MAKIANSELDQPELSIECLCKTIRVNLKLKDRTELPTPLNLCSCSTCRHTTGILCTSYFPIPDPVPSDLTHTTRYCPGNGKTSWYFCPTCGCHVFRKRGGVWEVATGVMDRVDGLVSITGHSHVSDTIDGGVSAWIKDCNGRSLVKHPAPSPSSNSISDTDTHERLPGSCHCGGVQFYITRPNAESEVSAVPFPDVMIPERLRDPRTLNQGNDMWWLQQNGRKYLAGICACRSCRLGSGFEIQPWAFIPQANIFIETGRENQQISSQLRFKLLDFTHHQPGTSLRSYNSSPGGTYREFCGTCGATVFWHNEEWRRGLIDVSVGLLNASEGALALDWLAWWTDRVSYEEEPEKDRPSRRSSCPFGLIPSLSRGLKAWQYSKLEGSHGR